MKTSGTKHYTESALYALTAALTIVAFLFFGFFLTEPSITHGQVDTAEFTIEQTITDETSFLVPPADVTTSGSINGITGGNASGTTDFVVRSNNSSGYTVEIAFFNNGTSEAMSGNDDNGDEIKDYGPAGGLTIPDYGYTASTAAQFAYTVTSNTLSDIPSAFLNDGSACNTGSSPNGTSSSTKCWMEPQTAGYEIVNRSTTAPTGATSTLEFDITVPSGATPQPVAQTYTATATLSLFLQ